MVIKTGRYGEFLSCTGYPTCKNARPVPLGVPCPKCGGDIIEIKSRRRGGRSFYGCSNYSADIKCDFKLWQKPDHRALPLVRREVPGVRRRQEEPDAHLCRPKECGFKKPIEEAAPPRYAGAAGARSCDAR